MEEMSASRTKGLAKPSSVAEPHHAEACASVRSSVMAIR